MNNKNDVIEYYNSFEDYVSLAREHTAVLNTHFGLMPKPPDDYCWIKSVAYPYLYPDQFSSIHTGMQRLHSLVFNQDLGNRRVLDVGCGVGGTIETLAKHNRQAQITGINFNRKQVGIANKSLDRFENVLVVEADFYKHQFEEKFDIIYFVESAFHMFDKPMLAKVIEKNLKAGGQLIIVDIFYSEKTWRRMVNKKSEATLFDYLPIQAWEEILAAEKIDITGYEDASEGVSHFVTINTSIEDYQKKLIATETVPVEKRENREKHLLEIYNGYKKLHRSLKKGILQYGILRATKR